MLNNYICALDIGSSKIASCVVEIKRRHVTNIFFESTISKGIKEGSVVDSIELVACIGRVLKGLKAKSGINIKLLFANISGQDIVTKHAHAIIPLAERGNKVITLSDMHRANEQARILGSSLEEEIIHQIPFSYSIDSKANILNPLGLYSHRLEVDLFLVCGKLSSIQSLSRAINQAGYELKNLFLSGIAISNAIFNKELKIGLNVLCDIGRDTTEILIFRDGLLRNIEILNMGGDTLTASLSEALKIPLDLAEDTKRSHTSVGDYERIEEDKEILIKKDNVYRPIKQKDASSIVTSKAKFICEHIKNSVEKNISLNMVDNFIVSGRTVLLEGFLEMFESTIGTPVKLGRISHSEIASFVNKNEALSGQRYLTYLTSLGIICLALQGERTQVFSTDKPIYNPILKAINKVKEVYQEYF